MSLLEVRGLCAGYGGVDILHGVDLAVAAGEVVVIVGPNGAGKSTAMKAIFGLIAVSEGDVRFDGAALAGLAPHRRVPLGLGYVPQERNVFPSLTVAENLDIGAYAATGSRAAVESDLWALFPPLRAKRRLAAGALSGGERQMLAMARALMAGPRLLLLDEPTAGLSPKYRGLIFERIRAIAERGVAVLMVEQNAKQALAIAQRGYVLVQGRNRHEASGAELLADPAVAEMFLGGAGGRSDG